MLLVFFAWLGFICISIFMLFHENSALPSNLRVVSVILLFIVLLMWSIRRARKQTEQATTPPPSIKSAPAADPSPTFSSTPVAVPASSADVSDVISFHVAGTTFSNDDGTSRQAILRHMKFGDSPYTDGQDPTDLSISIEESDFDEELALEVYANGYQIGFVPKKLISKVKRAMDQGAMVTAAQIIGGGKDDQGNIISWGCIVELEY